MQDDDQGGSLPLGRHAFVIVTRLSYGTPLFVMLSAAKHLKGACHPERSEVTQAHAGFANTASFDLARSFTTLRSVQDDDQVGSLPLGWHAFVIVTRLSYGTPLFVMLSAAKHLKGACHPERSEGSHAHAGFANTAIVHVIPWKV